MYRVYKAICMNECMYERVSISKNTGLINKLFIFIFANFFLFIYIITSWIPVLRYGDYQKKKTECKIIRYK